MSETIERKIRECWVEGMGLVEAQEALRRRYGASVEREDIRLRYVTLAAEWVA